MMKCFYYFLSFKKSLQISAFHLKKATVFLILVSNRFYPIKEAFYFLEELYRKRQNQLKIKVFLTEDTILKTWQSKAIICIIAKPILT